MKKLIFTFALVAVVSLLSVNAMAWGRHAGQGYGGCANITSQVDSKDYQDFLNSTADLRAEIAADRAEIAAEMAGQNPDSKRVRALTENMQKNVNALHEKAAALNIPANGGMGRGMGRGMGYGMMGGGMMRGGMMRGGMMGFNGSNSAPGTNCPLW